MPLAGEIQRRRASQAARADDEGVRAAHALLPLDAELPEQDVATVAQELLIVHGRRAS
jgi:hypothetical protein